MPEDKSQQTNQRAAVSPIQRGALLGAIALIIAAYAAYGVSHNHLSLAYWSSSGRITDKLHFTGTSAWLLAAAIWIVAAGLVIAIFEGPKADDAKAHSVPATFANPLYLFVGREAYKKQRLSVLVCFVGFVIGGVIYLFRMIGIL